MQQYRKSQTDIFIILIVTLCTITINLPFFKMDITIFKDLFSILLLFIPGYALLISLFPTNNRNMIIKAMCSFLISIGLLMLIVVIENIVFNSLSIKGANLTILLAVLTIILLIFAYMRRKMNLSRVEADDRILNDWIMCQKCGGYYQLQEGELLDDFERCQCGGKLAAVDYNLKHMNIKHMDKNLKAPEKESEEKQRGKPRHLPWDLILIFLLAILAMIAVFNPNLNESFIITILALPFFLFFPGYLLIYILFPKKDTLDDMERLLFSFGLSLIIAPIIGLLLNYTPFGIILIYILFALSIFTALMSIIAFIRRWKLAEEDRYTFNFSF